MNISTMKNPTLLLLVFAVTILLGCEKDNIIERPISERAAPYLNSIDSEFYVVEVFNEEQIYFSDNIRTYSSPRFLQIEFNPFGPIDNLWLAIGGVEIDALKIGENDHDFIHAFEPVTKMCGSYDFPEFTGTEDCNNLTLEIHEYIIDEAHYGANGSCNSFEGIIGGTITAYSKDTNEELLVFFRTRVD